MDTRDAIHKRRSIRWFTDEAIPTETIEQILGDAGRAPSWRNSQPWRIYVAQGATLDAIKADHLAATTSGVRGVSEMGWAHENTWDQPSQIMQTGWDRQLFQTIRGDVATFRTAQASLFNAQAAVYLDLFKNTSPWSILDLGGFAQTLLLSATAQGVQSIHAYEFVKYPAIVRQHLPIPEQPHIGHRAWPGLRRYRRDNQRLANDPRHPRADHKPLSLGGHSVDTC